MNPKFLNIDYGAGKKIAEALDEIFIILCGYNNIYSEKIIIDKDVWQSLYSLVQEIDQEVQEGSEWILDDKKP